MNKILLSLLLVLLIFYFSPPAYATGENGTMMLNFSSNIYIQNESALKSQFQPLYIKIVEFQNNTQKSVWQSLITVPEDTKISLPSGKYKFYIQLKGHRTIWELNNEGEGYQVSSGNETVIPLFGNFLGKEVLADAPWRIEPGDSIPVLVMVKDANEIYGDYDLGNIEFYRDNDCDRDPNENDDTPLPSYTETAWNGLIINNTIYNLYKPGDWYGITNLDPASESLTGEVCFHAVIRDIGGILDPDGDTHSFFTVNIASDPLPSFWNWYSGDTHYHSSYTDNKWEFGYPVEATVEAGKAVGLEWTTITDHSFDLDDIRTGETNVNHKWNSLKNAVALYQSDPSFKPILGEEVSVNRTDGRIGHFLVYGMENFNSIGGSGYDFFPGQADEYCEWHFPLPPSEDYTCSETWSLQQAISYVNSQDGIAFAAHPGDTGTALGRGGWIQSDYDLPGYNGLEIWNAVRTNETDWATQLENGLTDWKRLLKNGRRDVFIIGGTDAHGDFSHEYKNDMALWPPDCCTSESDNAYGKVRTVVYSDEGLTENGILEGLKNGHSIMTDGPLVTFTINNEIIGNTTEIAYETSPTLEISWKSSPEFGDVGNIKIYRGDSTGETKVFDNHPSLLPGGYSGTLQDGYATWTDPTTLTLNSYYRIEVQSSVGFPPNNVDYRAYTNPIWVDVWPYCTVSQGASISIQQTCIDDPDPPEAPSLVWPSSGETIADSTPTFVWNRPNDTGSGVDYYQIDVDGTSNFYGDTSPQPSYTWPSALSNGPHTWKVQARDGAGNYGNWSETRTFIVDTSNDQQTTAGTISETHACDSITVTATYSGDVDNDGSATLDYKLSSSGTWGGGIGMTDQGTQYQETISGLSESANYDVRVTYNDPDGVIPPGNNVQTITGINTGSCPINNPPYDVVIQSPLRGVMEAQL